MTVEFKTRPPLTDPYAYRPGPVAMVAQRPSQAMVSRTTFDFPSYLIDVSIVILRAIRLDLTHKLDSHDIHLHAFISHVFRTSKLSYSVLLSGLLYLLRFRYIVAKCGKALPMLRGIDVPILTYCLFLGSVMLSSKLLNDQGASNRRWAVYTGLPLSFVNQAEMAILEAIEYKINISKDVFDDWVKFLFRADYLAAYRNTHQTPPDAILLDEFTQADRPPSSSGVVPTYRQDLDGHSDSIADILLEFSNPRQSTKEFHRPSLFC